MPDRLIGSSVCSNRSAATSTLLDFSWPHQFHFVQNFVAGAVEG